MKSVSVKRFNSLGVNFERLTLVRLTSFHTMIGTMKIGMPIYDAKNVDVSQLPFKKTGKPAMSTMMVEPTNPTHAAYG